MGYQKPLFQSFKVIFVNFLHSGKVKNIAFRKSQYFISFVNGKKNSRNLQEKIRFSQKRLVITTSKVYKPLPCNVNILPDFHLHVLILK